MSDASSPRDETTTSSDPSKEEFRPDDGLLVLQDLTKKFGGLVAVDELSFKVESGEILGFIGPNGAGKSTTFNCVTGTYPPTSGTVYYDHEDVTGLPAYEMIDRRVGRTFQDLRAFQDRSVLENILFPLVPDKMLTLAGLDDTYRQQADEICEKVGLSGRQDQLPSELPHAGLLRLGIGRALATDPDLLLIDEPFAGLAKAEVKELSNLLESLRNEGRTLVVVDHNMHGLLNLVDRVIVLGFGSKVAEGSPEEITQNEDVQRAYLGGEL